MSRAPVPVLPGHRRADGDRRRRTRSGATVNVGLPGGCGDAEYAAVFDHVFLPALARFAPDLLLVSAGFDAFEHDPLAGMRVTHAGFARDGAAAALRRRARGRGGRIVAVLEGGYDLDGLAGGMTAVLAALPRPPRRSPTIAPLPAGHASRAPRSRARSPRTPPRPPIPAAGGAR